MPKWWAISWWTVSTTFARRDAFVPVPLLEVDPEDRDPRGDGRVVGANRRSRHALVQAKQAGRARRVELGLA